MKKLLLVLSLALFNFGICQDYSSFGEVIKLKLGSAPFPHSQRANGHTYSEKLYPADIHYSDSTVMVFIPKNFTKSDQTDFVIYFHGWYSNIDSSCKKFRIIQQFAESNKNAILIFPEGPKNAPDSFGGKLEDENGFSKMMDDIISELIGQKKISSQKIGNIVLAGHSGAYRVISYILMRGGLTENIKEVYLFDALYAELEKFAYWFTNYNGKFVDIFTNDGGTMDDSYSLMADLKGWRHSFLLKEEDEISDSDLKDNKLIFIHSKLGHNDVVINNDNLKRYLIFSCLK